MKKRRAYIVSALLALAMQKVRIAHVAYDRKCILWLNILLRTSIAGIHIEGRMRVRMMLLGISPMT
jgi:hypothetical protein